MARPLRIEFPDAWYHVMNRGAGRRKIFLYHSHQMKFLDLLREISEKYLVEIHAYCLMSNHYHLLIHTPHGNLSKAMQHLNSVYASFFNNSINKDGPIFRGRYKSIIISDDEYLLRLSRYIHLNPLKANMVRDLKSYRWSSYLDYIEIKPSNSWLKIDVIYKKFEKYVQRGILYSYYVENMPDDEMEKLFEITKPPPSIGNEDFIKRIDEIVKNKKLSPEIPEAKKIKKLPSIDEIVFFVSKNFLTPITDIRLPKTKKKNIPRAIAMALCREVGLHSLSDIAKYFGNVRYPTVSVTIKRAKTRYGLEDQINKFKSKF